MLDQRQYRDDQPCDDAVAARLRRAAARRATCSAAGRWSGPSSSSSSSKAAWKVVGSEVMMMPAKVLGGSYYTFDSWQGYQTEREELLAPHQGQGDRRRRLRHGRHPHVHRRRRAHRGRRGRDGRDWSSSAARSRRRASARPNLDAGGGVIIPGNDANPNTAAGADRRAARHQPLGRPGRLRPPRLRPREGQPQGLRRDAQARLDDQGEDDGDRDDRRLPLPRRARAEVRSRAVQTGPAA